MHLIRQIAATAMNNLVASTLITLCVTLMLVMLVLPESRASRDRDIEKELAAGRVAEIAESPDGTKVWAVEREGRTIYFSKGSLALEPIAGPVY